LSSKHAIVSLIFFYLAWYSCVLSAKYNFQLISLVLPIIYLALNISYIKIPIRKILGVFWLIILGVFFDFIALNIGMIQIQNTEAPKSLPLWLVSIWLLYFNVIPLISFQFRQNYKLLATLGFIFGPLTYKSGELFGLFIFKGTLTYIVYALFWSIFSVVSVYLFQRKQNTEVL